MIRSGLVRRLSEKRKIGVAEAELIVVAIFDTMAFAPGRNESVNIRGLGAFSARCYRGYSGRNPRLEAIVWNGASTIQTRAAPKDFNGFRLQADIVLRRLRLARSPDGASA